MPLLERIKSNTLLYQQHPALNDGIIMTEYFGLLFKFHKYHLIDKHPVNQVMNTVKSLI